MNKKIFFGLTVFIFLSLGNTLSADPMVYGLDNLDYMVVYYTIDDPSKMSGIFNFTGVFPIPDLLGRSDDGSSWSSPGDPVTGGYFVWNGSGIVTHITFWVDVVTDWQDNDIDINDGFCVLFSLDNPLATGDSQYISSDAVVHIPLNEAGQPYPIHHISGWGVPVPEPPTLLLLVFGLMAVSLVRR
jgi:hypothetical protein